MKRQNETSKKKGDANVWQDASRWHNVDVNQQNRAPRRAAFFAFENQDTLGIR